MKSIILSLLVVLMLVGCGSEKESFNIDDYLDEQTEVCESVHYKMTQYCYNEYYEKYGYNVEGAHNVCKWIEELRRCPRVVTYISDTYEKDDILLHLSNTISNKVTYDRTYQYCYEYLDENNESVKFDCGMY